MKNRTRRCLSLILAALMTITTVFGNLSLTAIAEDAATTIAEWSYGNESTFPESLPVATQNGSASAATLNVFGATYKGKSANSLSATEWQDNAGWIINNIDASEYENLKISAKFRTSNTSTSILYYMMQYSFDGANWTDIEKSDALTKSVAYKFNRYSLPSELNGKIFSIRFLALDANGEAKALSNTDGTSQINNVLITGTSLGSGTDTPSKCDKVYAGSGSRTILKNEEIELHCNTAEAVIKYTISGNDAELTYSSDEKLCFAEDTTITAYACKEGFENGEPSTYTFTIASCADVTANPLSGDIEKGSLVTLSCATEGATIKFALNDDTEYCDYSNPISITGDTVVKAYAVKDDTHKQGSVKNFEYQTYIPAGTLISTLNDGDKVVLFNAKSGKALSEKVFSDKYLAGVNCKLSADKLTYTKISEDDEAYNDIACLQVSKNAEGEYTFSIGEGENVKYLSTGPTGGSISFASSESDLTKWILDEKGCRNKSAVYKEQACYIEWYSSKNEFTATTYNDKYADYYACSFYSSYEIEEYVPPVVVEPVYASKLNRPFYDGDKVVVYYENGTNNGLVMSKNANGSKLNGVDAIFEGDKLAVDENALVLSVKFEGEDSVCFVDDSGKYLTSGATGSALTLNDTKSDYSLWKVEQKTDGWYIINANAKYGNKPQYVEYYKGFTTYSYNSSSDSIYLYDFYLVKEGVKSLIYNKDVKVTVAKWAGTVTPEEDSAKKVCGDIYASGDKLDTSAVYEVYKNGEKVSPISSGTYMGANPLAGDNTYLLFSMQSKGYANLKMSFRFRATATANTSYKFEYSLDGTEYSDFSTGTSHATHTYFNTGEKVEDNKNISNGVLVLSYDSEYYDVSFDIPAGAANAEKLFIKVSPFGSARLDKKESAPAGNIRIDSVVITGNPVIDDSICSFVSATPDSGSVALGEKITLSTLTEGATIKYSVNGGEFNTYDAAAGVTFDKFPSVLTAYAVKEGLSDSIKTTYTYTQAQCEPVKASPNGGAVRINTELKLKDKTEGSAIFYRFSEEDGWKAFEDDLVLSTLPVTIQVKATKNGFLDSAVSTLSFTQKQNEKYNIYFGQIHSHTTISDGAGSLEEAFNHAKEVKNLDYIVVTDHSNSFDDAALGDITKNTDTKETNEWTYAHNLADSLSTADFTCLYGYEMTWSNGLGHMNTYNTPGFQSRTQDEYATYSTALNNYYTALEKVPDSISMFNHPGTTFGDFQDFAYYSEARDALINLIEVGNGEGAIGSSGYFPSYEYYTRALDKGWHVAPTNNQDNHKGLWGDANTARTVVLADANNEENIYDAMRNRRVYATEDNDLSIYYTLDGHDMGEILEKDAVGETVELKVELADPTDPVIGKVSVVVNGGLVIDSKNINSNSETVVFNVPSVYSYYYIRIDEGDKDIAVTAPVWVGEVEACGIASVSTDTVLAVAGEEIDINVGFYNNEKLPLELTRMEIDVLDAESVLTHVASLTKSDLEDVTSNGTFTKIINYTYNAAGKVTYIVKATALLNGVEKIYEGKLSANYVAPEMVGNIIIDGSHFNDYVTGNYGGNMNNFISMAADANLRAKVVTDKITAETLEDCRLLVISAPAKKNGTANAGEYTISHFDDVFIETVKNYVARGGNLIVCGLADYQDSNECQSSTELNKLLTAVGSTLRINSDEICDDVKNGGQKFRLYPENFNTESELLAGLVNGQVYSQYSGCSVYAESNEETDFVYAPAKLVTGFDTTYCLNSTGHDSNFVDLGKGNVNFLMSQETKAGGYILAAGGVFVSDFEVKAELDNNDSLPYANYTIASNLIKASKVQLPVSTIAEARAGETGEVFAVEGYVTSGTDNEFTTFFDTIYIQDDTAGIDIFPYAEAGLAIGTKVRITGFVSSYQGDKELKVIEVEILDAEPYVYEAKELSAKDAMDYEKFGGSLLKTTGVVSKVLIENGALAEFWLNDGSGKEAAIFIDGYIYSGTTGKNDLASKVKVGATVSAEGVLYMHPEGNSDVSVPVFRVRNCDDITIIKEAANSGSETGSGSNTGASSSDGATASTPSAKETVSTPATTAVPGRTTTASIPSTTADVVEENDTIETVDDTKAEVEEEATTAAPENEEVSIGEDAAPTAGLSDTEKTGLGLWLVIGGGVAAVCVAGYGVFHFKKRKSSGAGEQ